MTNSPDQRLRTKPAAPAPAPGARVGDAMASGMGQLPESPGRLVSAIRILWGMRNHFNPIAWARPERIVYLLDAYYAGDLTIAKLWDAVQRRDEIVVTAIEKRFENVGRLDVQYPISSTVPEGLQARAKEHQAVLKAFWDSIKVTEALKQDVCGGVKLLGQQILACRLQGWAAHEKVWILPANGKGLSAKFILCPLWWFENRAGKLRYLAQDYDTYGVPMDPLDWLVSASPRGALMESGIILWLFKHFTLQDWMAWLEKYGQPYIDIATDAREGTDEFNQLMNALRDFANDGGMIHSRSTEVKMEQAQNQTDPFSSAEEVLSRKITMLVLHADLQMQSRNGGQGVGASLQNDEPMKLLASDSEFVNERLRTISNEVTQYYFGEDALASVCLVTPSNKDTKQELEVDKFFGAAGLPLDRDECYERYGRTQPTAEDAVILSTKATPGAGGTAAAGAGNNEDPVAEDLANAVIGSGLKEEVDLVNVSRDRIAQRLAALLQPLRERAAQIEKLPSDEEKRAALIALHESLPGTLRSWGVDPSLQRYFEDAIGTSIVNGLMLDQPTA